MRARRTAHEVDVGRERATVLDKHAVLSDEVTSSGELVAGPALSRHPEETRTLPHAMGGTTVTIGSRIETIEQLTVFYELVTTGRIGSYISPDGCSTSTQPSKCAQLMRKLADGGGVCFSRTTGTP
jgi:hypothetical protein